MKASQIVRLLAVVPLVLITGGSSWASPMPRLATARVSRSLLDRTWLHHTRPQFGPVGRDVPQPVSLTGQPNADRQGKVTVVLELAAPPVLQAFARARANASPSAAETAARTQLAQITAAQQSLAGPLAALNAQVIYRVQRVYNGIAVRVDAAEVPQLRLLPGLKAVHYLHPNTISTSTSVPFIGAPQLWNSSGITATGQGIKIGIIDSGIDYIHTDLGGSGMAADYSRNDTTAITDSDNFPNSRVVGGIDLVGDSYDATPTDATYQPIPHPDPDPAPCYPAPYGPGGSSAEHGTHVAGIAAGSGVNADGTAYTGPYSSTIPFSSFRIGPGVAPRAQLYSIRVFGCNGSTDMLVPAIEWAVDPNGDGNFSDHLDVINMSIGADYGPADAPDAVASDNAALAGVIVAASAGNSGDTYYVTGSPANSGRAISVASSLDNGLSKTQLLVNSPFTATLQAANASFGPTLDLTGTTGDLVYAQPTDGCSALANASSVTGHIALIDRGSCFFDVKVFNAQQAGATAVVIVNNRAGAPITMGSSGTLTGTVTIPSVMISQHDGTKIKSDLPSPGVNVTMQSVPAPELADTLSSFSSRGPRQGDSFLKPDIAVPGDTITSAGDGTGTGALTLSGTSMASPHIAGTMALLRQLHPDWTVEELKALVMNTATHDLRSDTPPNAQIYGPGRIGAGRVDVANAGQDSVIAFNNDDPGVVSLSFGTPEAVSTLTASKNLRIENKGSSPVTYALSYTPVVSVPGVTYTLGALPVTLAAGQSTAISVTLSADASQMKHTRDATVSNMAGGQPRHWISEAAGYVVLTPLGGGQSLRVPVYAVPRPASAMSGTGNTIDVGNDAVVTTSLGLSGTGLDTTGGMTLTEFDERSLAMPLELQQSSPVSPGLTGSDAAADIKYVGVSSNATAYGSVTNPNSEVYFGVATYAPWTTPGGTYVQVWIYIDTNNDGIPDYVLFNTNAGQATGSGANDTFLSELCNLNTNACSLEDYLNGLDAQTADTVPFNTNVMVLPVYTADLGLTNSASSFSYWVSTYPFNLNGALGDQTNVSTYDAGHPGLDFTGGYTGVPIWFDQPGARIPLTYTCAAYVAANSQGILLFHYHNAMGSHDEVVPVLTDAAQTATAIANGTATAAQTAVAQTAAAQTAAANAATALAAASQTSAAQTSVARTAAAQTSAAQTATRAAATNTPTPTNTPVPPTSTSVPAPSNTPVPPTNTSVSATSTVPPATTTPLPTATSRPGSVCPAKPGKHKLSLSAPRKVQTGKTLTAKASFAARNALGLLKLQVLSITKVTVKVKVKVKGKITTKTQIQTRTRVLYSVQVKGKTSACGTYQGRLTVRYRLKKAVVAVLTLAVGKGKHPTMATARVTIQPASKPKKK